MQVFHHKKEVLMKRRHFVSLMLMALMVVWVGANSVFAGQATVFTKVKTEKVDLNTAKADQLSALPGIGEKKAGAIVEYRVKNGPFATVEDLLKVKGIGEKLLEKIKPLVTVSAKRSDLHR
jgi:comEA protein